MRYFRLFLLSLLLLVGLGFFGLTLIANAQEPGLANRLQVAASAPVGSCVPDGGVRIVGANVYVCSSTSHTWGSIGGVGSVTSVATGNGLSGGPITGTGTIDLRLNASGGLSKTLGGGSNELGIAASGVTNAMLAGSITISKLSITGTPDGTKFLRDDGTWQAVSGSGLPGGASGTLQVNNGAGGFAGITNSAYSGSSLAVGGAVDASAQLAVVSTVKGFLPPRMTTAQRDAIGSPTQGLVIHNTTTGALGGYLNSNDGNRWQSVLTDYSYFNDPNPPNGDNNFKPSVYWRNYVSGTTANTGFTTYTGFTQQYVVTHGDNFGDGASAQAKSTFAVSSVDMIAKGAGQKFTDTYNLDSYSSGDTISVARTINQWGGVTASGDEATKMERYAVYQGRGLTYSTVQSVVAPATINTTTTQIITANKDPQSVSVGSSAGVVVDQWVTVAPSTNGIPFGKTEVVKVTAVPDGTHITAVFRADHASGVAIKPATVLVMDTTYRWGEGRAVINMSATPYNTGTAAWASSRSFTGSGTTWANNMVGGNADNPGYVSFSADDITSSPYSGGSPLRMWYPLIVDSPTALSVRHLSQVGMVAYSGLQTSQAAYTIRPGARLLSFDPRNSYYTQTIVLEYNTFTWNVGDTLECAFSPDADVSGATWDFSWFSPGSTLRAGLFLTNSGLQDFETAISIGSYGTAPGGWETAISAVGKLTGVFAQGAVDAISVSGSGGGGAGGTINFGSANARLGWDGSNYYLRKNTAGGSDHTLFEADSTAATTTGLSSVGGSQNEWKAVATSLFLSDTSNARDPRLRMRGNQGSEWWLQPSFSAALGNARIFEFYNYNNGNGDGNGWGTVAYLSNGIGTYRSGIATNGVNKSSFVMAMHASIWDGAAAADKKWIQQIDPVSNSTNANQRWSMWRPTSNSSYPALVFSVDTNGKLSFGTQNFGSGVESDKGVVLDPANITSGQVRIFMIPDRAGSPTLGTTTGTLTSGNLTKFDSSGNIIDAGIVLGTGGAQTFTGVAFASLGTPSNGTLVYCTDCVKGGNPCAGSGTGSFAQRLNGVWRCD